jgi:intraflagellar transport protein 122
MQSAVVWSDQVPNRSNRDRAVWDICFNPDGTQMIVAVTNRVLVYDAIEADLLQSLRGHKGTVFTVAYSFNGKFFASGGADNTIIIWNSEAEGQLKYNHNDPIQKLAYNPVTQQLISCTASDFGLWSPEAKAVQKHKVQSRILCADWTKNGQYVALGMYNGVVSIRHNVDNQCEEKFRIEKPAPVWCLAWNPNPKDSFDTLAVGCWDQTLSFHNMEGPNGTELSCKKLGYNPCDLNFLKDGEYFVIGGSNKKVTLMTAEGISLGDVAEREAWVWSCTPRPGKNFVAVGANDGNISMYQQIFNTVHGLYEDRYAFRENMTDVVVEHLITEKKIKIRHKDYVKKIAVYKDRLAVQLPDRVTIYELPPKSANSMKMNYRARDKIKQKLKCNLLVVTSLHITLCLDKKLQLLNFKGKKEREWVLDSNIRYIKVIGGPPGREGLLVGLKNGTVLKIFIDNPFPIKLIKQTTAIRCLDLNCDRTKLAVVDENADCLVYNVETKELLYKEPNVNSVAWNSEIENMIAMSGNNMITVKISDFVMHSQKQAGFVVGFSAAKLFCLQQLSMQVVDVPQSQSLQRYIKSKDFDMAIRVACLGVTEADWKTLGLQALYNMKVEVARESFLRINDLHLVTLASKVEQDLKDKSKPRDVILGDILAFEGKFMEAEKLYCRNSKIELALEMYSDLWKYDEAKRVARVRYLFDTKD